MQPVASDMHGGVAMASYFEITKLPLPYFDKVTRTNKRSCESIHHVRRSAAEDIRSKDIQVAICRNLYNAGYAMLLLTCLSLPADGNLNRLVCFVLRHCYQSILVQSPESTTAPSVEAEHEPAPR